MYLNPDIDLEAMGSASTPSDKMRKLRDIVEIYKIALGKGRRGDAERSATEELIDKLLMKTILAANVPNLVSQLSYIEFYLASFRCSCPRGN